MSHITDETPRLTHLLELLVFTIMPPVKCKKTYKPSEEAHPRGQKQSIEMHRASLVKRDG